MLGLGLKTGYMYLGLVRKPPVLSQKIRYLFHEIRWQYKKIGPIKVIFFSNQINQHMCTSAQIVIFFNLILFSPMFGNVLISCLKMSKKRKKLGPNGKKNMRAASLVHAGWRKKIRPKNNSVGIIKGLEVQWWNTLSKKLEASSWEMGKVYSLHFIVSIGVYCYICRFWYHQIEKTLTLSCRKSNALHIEISIG